FPVEYVSWEDAVSFCEKLTELAKKRLGEQKFRLPTEAEWEYACRGVASSSKPFHVGKSLSSQQANFNENYPDSLANNGRYLRRTTTVGSHPANNFGLYDMHGNVFQWCADYYGKYEVDQKTDPDGPAKGDEKERRVLRGGAWNDSLRHCRAAYRFRCVGGYRL